ncbi:MAG: DUF2232 domain-containing protein [Candidatus Binatus sp.]|uniref:DUF2232 domain-containing protein n=1 Tax=Candidatus Binatus sp. TaxID=2811406 RepID=UPI00272337E6|nr:DUF2232 domain-containing protein [Candidatus Binatus sp.]MDO8434877.1 DUF2232 domain-containing protein [Candidatus Binatus sp.]
MTRKAVIGMIRAAALAGAFFLAGGAIPVLGGIAMLFAPAPILIFAVGRPSPNLRAIIAMLLAGAFVALLAGPIAGIGYFVSFGLATAIMCYMLERGSSFERIAGVTAAAMVAAVAAVALAFTGGPDGLIRTLHDELAQGMARGQEFYKYFGVQQTITADTQASIIATTIRLSPAFLILLAGCTALLNLRVFWRWVGPQRLPYSLFGDLSRWSAPEWMVWLLLASGFGLFIPVSGVSDLALSGFIAVAAIYFCQGLAIVGFYFHSLAVPAIVRAIIYFVVFAQPVVAGVLCIAGIFDMWIDFRRLKPPSHEAGNLGDFF